jgi:hypothetical protein
LGSGLRQRQKRPACDEDDFPQARSVEQVAKKAPVEIDEGRLCSGDGLFRARFAAGMMIRLDRAEDSLFSPDSAPRVQPSQEAADISGKLGSATA